MKGPKACDILSGELDLVFIFKDETAKPTIMTACMFAKPNLGLILFNIKCLCKYSK